MTPDELIEAQTSDSDEIRVDIAEDTASDLTPMASEETPKEASPAEESPELPVVEQAEESADPESSAELEVPEVDVEPEPAGELETPPADDDTSAPQDGPVVEASVEAAPEVTLDDTEQPAPVRARVAWWPFAIYAVLWVSLAGATYYLLQGSQADMPAFRQEAYPYLLLAGLVLVLVGPLLSILLWFAAWRRADQGDRGGLFTRAMIRGAAITFVGVAVWYGALNLVDVVRLGWI